MSNEYGIVSAHSSSRTINFIAKQQETPLPIVGRLVYFDTQVSGETYRSIGTVANMMTENTQFNLQYEGMIARTPDVKSTFPDLRKSEVSIQAVFKRSGDGVWGQHGSALPTSPSTGATVHLLEEETIKEMLTDTDYASIGFFRGLTGTPLPLDIKNFDSSAGARHTAVSGISGSGKDLAIDTPIPTPSGWKTMGELQDGDTVYNEFGKPITVIKAHEFLTDSLCYEVVFSDGSKLVAGSGHLWFTETPVHSEVNSTGCASFAKNNSGRGSLLGAEQVSHVRMLASESHANQTITVAEAVRLIGYSGAKSWVLDIAKSLPVLGHTGQGLLRDSGAQESISSSVGVLTRRLTMTPPVAAAPLYSKFQFLNLIAEHGSRVVGDKQNAILLGSVKTTQEIKDTLLVSDGVSNHSIPLSLAVEYPEKNLLIDPYALGTSSSLGSTSIPVEYLQGSVNQRRDLLAGLMDSSGYPAESARVEFVNTSLAIAEEVYELASSLGYQAIIEEVYLGHSSVWTVGWSTADDIFKLSNKIEAHRKASRGFDELSSSQRYIVAVNQIPTVTTRCITVDSPAALYLAGKQFIPTHNTQAYALVLGSYMKHENHAILVIDPQGQWSSENGMIFSPQNLARGLGREVSTIRVSEDIKLPMDIEILTKMINKVNLWTRFRRMGTEQKDSFSREVAERIASTRDLDVTSRTLLTKIFSSIANSQNTLSRIYVKGERQDSFRNELLMLAGEPLPENDEGEIPITSAEDLEDAEQVWENVLFAFKPLHNLFSSKNLAGNRRQPLGGPTGFLTQVLQVRDVSSKPAPYVIFDMSPNIELHAKSGLDRSNADFAMQKLLDDQDVKALILTMVLEELKKASEVAFAIGGGNLNTQIVFDEAWRYAPEGRSTPEIETLASMLEGFALDTRKFGIGWTYILQSPSDLKYGIWRQLTYVYAGYGLVGEDVRKLEALTDDSKQIDLYRQFISPASTGEYPFMIMGPISPLIFTSSPTFLNAFKSNEEFLEHNHQWINAITKKRSLPQVTADYLTKKLSKAKAKTAATDETNAEPASYQIGKSYKISEPQVAVKKVEPATGAYKADDLAGETPF